MSMGYQIDDQYGMYFVTWTVVDWVDVFSRKAYRDIIMDSLLFSINNKELKLYCYVIMTNHVHLILQSSNGTLSKTIGEIKKFSARKIIEAINTEPESRREWLLHRLEWNAKQNKRSSDNQLWMHENHAILITSEAFFQQKMKYIHNNPVRAGWVNKEEDYVYSSAQSLFTGVTSVIPLSYI